MKKKQILIVVFIVLGAFLMYISREKYDESIHDHNLEQIIHSNSLTQYINKDESKKFGYNISIFKSDTKETLPYISSSKEYYKYNLVIRMNENFTNLKKSEIFDYAYNLSSYLKNITVGANTKFEGHYDMLILAYYSDSGDKTWRMNINGFPQELNNQSKEEFTILYYDENGNAVRE